MAPAVSPEENSVMVWHAAFLGNISTLHKITKQRAVIAPEYRICFIVVSFRHGV
jgi:hypothetical protein